VKPAMMISSPSTKSMSTCGAIAERVVLDYWNGDKSAETETLSPLTRVRTAFLLGILHNLK
jgi:hypothetical protein